MNDTTKLPRFRPEKVEKVARQLCVLRGLDPDELVQVPHPEGYAVCLRRPQWEVAKKDVLLVLEVALAGAMIGMQPEDLVEGMPEEVEEI